MTQLASPLRIVYGSDDNYAKFMGISMYSLFETNGDFESIEVYVLDCGIKEENKENLRSIADAFHRDIFFVDMAGAVESLNLHMGAKKIAIASYARLFMPSLLPDSCDKVLYLDCDTLVRQSLKDLWEISFGTALIAGVQDTVDSYFLNVIGLEKEVQYINAGIILVNLKAWREENMQQKFMAFIEKFGGNVPHHDQGTINGTCGDRRIIAPLRFNVTANLYSFSAKTIRKIYFLQEYYSQEELDDALNAPAIVHFTSGLLGRPWEENSTHPLRDTFWDTVKKTPWRDLASAPDTRSFGLKAFIFFHKITPRPIFEFVYRNISWALHLRK